MRSTDPSHSSMNALCRARRAQIAGERRLLVRDKIGTCVWGGVREEMCRASRTSQHLSTFRNNWRWVKTWSPGPPFAANDRHQVGHEMIGSCLLRPGSERTKTGKRDALLLVWSVFEQWKRQVDQDTVEFLEDFWQLSSMCLGFSKARCWNGDQNHGVQRENVCTVVMMILGGRVHGTPRLG